jgi:uncharacterized membrane protein YbhN (UPF0104 family)
MEFFDYIYFRTYCWYKSKKEPHYHLMGILIVALLVSMLLFSFLTILTFFLFHMPTIEKWHCVIYLAVIILVIRYRYNKFINIEDLHNKWSKESKMVKYRRGWLIIGLLVTSIAFPILIGYLRHNLGLQI